MSVIETLSYDKVYKQGFNINTPIDLNLQTIATKSLRDGLIAYDKRKGWRGPLTNKIYNSEWKKDLEKYKLENSINWKLAIVKKINKFSADIETEDNIEGVIEYQSISWTKKEFNKLLKPGDVIYVKNLKENIFNLQQLPKVNGGIVVMDPFTGRVLALSGGFSFKQSEFNRATQAKRQPGSAFKPIVYAAALENGFAPNTIILDAPFVESQGVGLKNWKPENYGKKFYGPSTLRKGIEYSRNLMTVRIAKILGLKKILKLSKELSIYDEIPELLSVSLGSAETTLINLTSAYAPFVNGGKKLKPKLISRIQDRRGKTIFQQKERKCIGCDKFVNGEQLLPKIEDMGKKVISEETAYQMNSILQGTVERGTAKKLRTLNVPLAGKTGTTNDNYDAWFIGFSSNIVIGVYVGYDNPKTLGKNETGSKVALPIFKSFIENALYKDDFKDFEVPEKIYLTSINYDSGIKSGLRDKKSIIEALKLKDINNIDNKNLISIDDNDNIIKLRQFY